MPNGRKKDQKIPFLEAIHQTDKVVVVKEQLEKKNRVILAIQEVYNRCFDVKELQENVVLFLEEVRKGGERRRLKRQLKCMEQQRAISVINEIVFPIVVSKRAYEEVL